MLANYSIKEFSEYVYSVLFFFDLREVAWYMILTKDVFYLVYKTFGDILNICSLK